jgi:hypothetical protein
MTDLQLLLEGAEDAATQIKATRWRAHEPNHLFGGPGFLLWLFGWMCIIPGQAIFSNLDLLVPLFDEYRQFYGEAGDVDGTRTSPKDRFEHGESVVFLGKV